MPTFLDPGFFTSFFLFLLGTALIMGRASNRQTRAGIEAGGLTASFFFWFLMMEGFFP